MSDIMITEKLRLDLGCGPNKREGFIGVDSIDFLGVDQVVDLNGPWPWGDNTVEHVHMSHFLEHFTRQERCHIMNELYRVLVPGGKSSIIVPHWDSPRYHGDPTHKETMSEWFFLYLDKTWRLANAPHTQYPALSWGYDCDFHSVYGYNMRYDLQVRNHEFQQFALQNYKGAADDLVAEITSKKP